MAVVRLRAPLSELAGGREHRLEATTVAGLLRALEQQAPALSGWVLDETGRIREHVNVYVNGIQAREDTAVDLDDRVHVFPAITGG